MGKKLTKAQREALTLAAENDYVSGFTSYVRDCTVQALHNRGLVKGSWNVGLDAMVLGRRYLTFKITDAGRKALEECNAKA